MLLLLLLLLLLLRLLRWQVKMKRLKTCQHFTREGTRGVQ